MHASTARNHLEMYTEWVVSNPPKGSERIQ